MKKTHSMKLGIKQIYFAKLQNNGRYIFTLIFAYMEFKAKKIQIKPT